MLPWLLLGGGVVLGWEIIAELVIGSSVEAAVKENLFPSSPQGNPDPGFSNVTMTVPVDNLVPVVFNGEVWLVTPDYIGPIGINEAVTLAKNAGFELPTPGLVDAIWRQADLKLVPLPRENVISQAVFDDQRRKILAQVAGRDFTLLGGSYKDVVMMGGKPSIYGWSVDVEHGATVPGVPLHKPFTPGPGMIIQPFAGGVHDQPGPIGFKDYSMGARLVRRA